MSARSPVYRLRNFVYVGRAEVAREWGYSIVPRDVTALGQAANGSSFELVLQVSTGSRKHWNIRMRAVPGGRGYQRHDSIRAGKQKPKADRQSAPNREMKRPSRGTITATTTKNIQKRGSFIP
ncbi:unnamed protein product [Pieris macdunnoughi]|uniref:Uncharacterized protein n=1 Tax=Pieris macdunnoughi TaxID=345717 RepID=A0A821KZW1_9NEOP|nr:unnamed protein product [Pieris macdunnoughi]